MSDFPTHSYPQEHEGWLTLKDKRKIFIRPVLPTDGPLLVDLFKKLSPQSPPFDSGRQAALRLLSNFEYISYA